MKKIILPLLASMLLTVSCQAASNITIERVRAAKVLEFTKDFYSTIGSGVEITKEDDRSVVFSAVQNAGEEDEYVERVRFLVTQKDWNVDLKIEKINIVKGPNGKPMSVVVNKPGEERFVLAVVKGAFNDHYSFGYVLSSEYRHGGFVIASVKENSAAWKAGLRPKDVLTHVDKVAIAEDEEGLYNGNALPNCFTGEPALFTVRRTLDIKTVKITPEPEKALLDQGD